LVLCLSAILPALPPSHNCAQASVCHPQLPNHFHKHEVQDYSVYYPTTAVDSIHLQLSDNDLPMFPPFSMLYIFQKHLTKFLQNHHQLNRYFPC
uniref:Secreted protein n=1 Tax=Ciona intestinalis TaxID=7719 RepID=H2Y304_CIOIN